MKDGEIKEGDALNQKVIFLNQLIASLEQAEEKLEKAYLKEDQNQFNIIRDFMLKIQNKISENIK